MAEGFKGLWRSWSSPTVHTAILTSSAHLHCSVLVSRSLNKDICLRKALPYLHTVPPSNHIPFFLTLCHYQQSLMGSTAIWALVCEICTLSPLYSWLRQSTGKYFWLIFNFYTLSSAEKQSRMRLIIMNIFNKKV